MCVAPFTCPVTVGVGLGDGDGGAVVALADGDADADVSGDGVGCAAAITATGEPVVTTAAAAPAARTAYDAPIAVASRALLRLRGTAGGDPPVAGPWPNGPPGPSVSCCAGPRPGIDSLTALCDDGSPVGGVRGASAGTDD